MAGRSHGPWRLNRPWYTDWVLWATAAVGGVGVGLAIAQQGGLTGPAHVVAVAFDIAAGVALATVCGAALVLVRAAFRLLLAVKPGRERVLTLTVRLKELGASVKYTRHPNGIVTAAVRGVPLRRRMEVLAAATPDAERHGFLVSTSELDAYWPGQ